MQNMYTGYTIIFMSFIASNNVPIMQTKKSLIGATNIIMQTKNKIHFHYILDSVPVQVSVALLRYYETHILRCRTMESISEFLKGKMPQLILDNMPTVLEDALNMDLGNKLTSYETEYFVLEELTTSFQLDPEAQDLKALNESFRNHNKELIEQLAFCRGLIGNLESTVATLQEAVKKQDLRIEK